jgi:peptide/nickel transport system ATP-binding protein
MSVPAIEVRGLRREFRASQGLFAAPRRVIAVDDVNFSVPAGSVLGVVGESGCGKTTLARMILGLMEPSAGEVLVDGKRLEGMDRRARARLIQPVFQDPFSSLNPRRRVRDIIAMPLVAQGDVTTSEVDRRVAESLERVGLSTEQGTRFPSQLSGGQRQRVAIARALVLRPRIVVCDEPTSALDVSVQAQILNLLAELRRDLGLTYLFISHDLGLVRYFCERIVVMYLGSVVEDLPSPRAKPRHPYTPGLQAAIPRLDGPAGHRLVPIAGQPPDLARLPPGCAFAPRCTKADARCATERPVLREVMPLHFNACHHDVD